MISIVAEFVALISRIVGDLGLSIILLDFVATLWVFATVGPNPTRSIPLKLVCFS